MIGQRSGAIKVTVDLFGETDVWHGLKSQDGGMSRHGVRQ